MSEGSQAPCPAEDFARRAERRIMERTWRQLTGLAVEVDGECVIVHGRAPSYYVKQLAIRAVQELLDGQGPGPAVRFDLEVAPAAPALADV
jgi:hypothetical protein